MKNEFIKVYTGYKLETENFVCHFGNQNSNLENLKKEFSNISFTRIKQTHSDIICESKPDWDLHQIADAHFTIHTHHALCINTADCIPILVYAYSEKHKKNIACAIHAGWKGVANRILTKSLEQIFKQGFVPSELQIYLGPHIRFESFEVMTNVKDQILSSISQTLIYDIHTTVKKKSEEKFLVNLEEVLRLQMIEFHIASYQINNLTFDTLTSTEYHSFRRDKENSGRQISFISLKN